MLRKCKTVIATIVVTVMMFSVFSYAGARATEHRNGSRKMREHLFSSRLLLGIMKALAQGSLKVARR